MLVHSPTVRNPVLLKPLAVSLRLSNGYTFENSLGHIEIPHSSAGAVVIRPKFPL
jgi:hypothetical protein